MARVSRQTVSNVLNNRTGYSEETRTRVLAAIEALDYQPHRAARSLRSQRTMQLGYHMPGEQLAAENAFVLGFIQALVRAAADHGHHVLVFTEQGDELEVFRELVAIRGVDGFILSGSRVDDPRARYLHQAGVPFAMFGRTAPRLPQTWVDIDSVAAASSAVDYLVGKGHESFAYVGYDAGTLGRRAPGGVPQGPGRPRDPGRRALRHPRPQPGRRSTARCSGCSAASAARRPSSPAATCWPRWP